MAVLESQKDECSLLFIGSSHYRNALDPILFDRLTAEAGCSTRSFNFSLLGMQLPEILHVLKQIRALRPTNLKWVVVEPRMKVHFRKADKKKRRLVYFHDIPASVMALRCVRHHWAEPREGRFYYHRMHLQQFGYRLTNQGLAQSLITSLYHGNSPARLDRLQRVISFQGYEPRRKRKYNPSNGQHYEEKVRAFATRFRRAPLKPELALLLATLLREIEAMGARPIFLFTAVMEAPYDLQLPAGTPAVDIIRLDDVERYPELFALENRWDENHMNTSGAALTTTAAAEAFLRIASGKDKR